MLNLRWASKNQLQPRNVETEAITPLSHSPSDARAQENASALDAVAHSVNVYPDSPWPFDDFVLSDVEMHGRYLMGESFEEASQPMTTSRSGAALNHGAPSIAQDSAVSDWPSPGDMTCESRLPFNVDVALSRPFEFEGPAMRAPGDSFATVPRTGVAESDTIHRELTCRSSALVEYFFKEVVSLYCAWDSSGNYMRKLAERRWQFSPTLYHTIQSMSAACLTESFPYLASTAVSEHSLALQCLSQTPDDTVDEDRLMSIILLGPTSSWHDPGNLAHGTLHVAQRMLGNCSDRQNTSFFESAVDYWTMLLSFMTDMSNVTSPHSKLKSATASKARVVPHPFTGISQDIIKILSDVGSLVYRHLSRKQKAQFITDADLTFFSRCIRQARNLERQLLQHRPASSQRMDDLGDPNTTLEHLKKIDDAYRFTGLLQIYRVFPDLLIERYSPWSDEDVLNVSTEPVSSTKADRALWLRSFAMHILSILQDIPFESRTRCLQPFILVACSSELARSPIDHDDLGSVDASDELLRDNIDLMRARDFVQSRLASYRHVLPLRKISQVQEVVKEVWSLLDHGASDVYWLDVCIQKKLVTLPS
ncbi:fungal specific transcription factor domain-containing protein [Sarocladium implicatum]|nr:fungal specific transcription factor domain-containing protein [Sarocladium implicatum]